MIISNETAYPHLFFELDVGRQQVVAVLVVRAGFELGPGTPGRHAKQLPPNVADRYLHDPSTSSLLQASHLVPFKKSTDICVRAAAISPHGVPIKSWITSVRIGRLSHEIRVTGPRHWERSVLGARRLSDPIPTGYVDLVYENAFGGKSIKGGKERVCGGNPIGRGYSVDPRRTMSDGLGPQLESPDDPIQKAGGNYIPQCYLPIPPFWQPRLSLAGTYDEAWRNDRMPYLPVDFRPEFYNSANPALIYPGLLEGGEEVVLAGMSAEGRLSFIVPDARCRCRISGLDWTAEVEPRMDTMEIDMGERRLDLIVRYTFAATLGATEVVLQELRSEVAHGRE